MRVPGLHFGPISTITSICHCSGDSRLSATSTLEQATAVAAAFLAVLGGLFAGVS